MKDISRKRPGQMPIIALLLFGIFLTTSAFSIGAAGNKAADFTSKGLDGEEMALSEILKERKAVLVFWATWCPSCKEEVPHIEKFYKENKERAAVIGVNAAESKAKVEAYASKNKISYPIVLDADGSIGRLYGVRGVPTIVVVDRESKIIYYGHSIEEMEEAVDF